MKSLNLLVLPCRSIEQSRAFYEVFGLSFVQEQHGSGPLHYSHHDAQGVLELYPANGPLPAELAGLGFVVRDLAETHERFRQLGFTPEAMTDRPWGRTFVVRDPDGRRVEVKQGP